MSRSTREWLTEVGEPLVSEVPQGTGEVVPLIHHNAVQQSCHGVELRDPPARQARTPLKWPTADDVVATVRRRELANDTHIRRSHGRVD